MKSLCKFLLWSAVLSWMAVIFFLSAQPAQDSSALSGQAIRAVVAFFQPDFFDLSKAQQAKIIASYQNVVRKFAHGLVYMVLGMLTMAALIPYSARTRKKVVIALLLCAAYAMTDEFHQLFVGGRSGEIRDVVVDICGAAAGIGFVLAAKTVYFHKGGNS